MAELEVLIREKLAVVDGIDARSVTVYEITSLDHESRNDPVECGSLVEEWFTMRAHSFLPCITRELREHESEKKPIPL